MSNPNLGVEVLKRIWPMVEDIGVIDKPSRLEGRYVNMLVIPKKDDKKK